MATLKVYKGTKIFGKFEVKIIGRKPDLGRFVRIRKNPEDELPETNKWLLEDDGIKYTILQPKKVKDNARMVFVEYEDLKIKE